MKRNLKQLGVLLLFGSMFFIGTHSMAMAETKDSASFDAKLADIETRSMMLHMVIKQLSHTFKKAAKDHVFMIENGMDPKDVEHLEQAYHKKIQKMTDEAITEINNI